MFARLGSVISFATFRSRSRRGLLVALALAVPGLAVENPAAGSEIAVLRQKIQDGDTEALHLLGQAYAGGRGVPQDFAEALKLYQRAADRGLAAGWFSLGMANELGQGVAANPEEAFKCYLKAAERGYPAAQFNVGNMYANGVGVTQNLLEAAVWFRQAAESGVPEAQFNLGLAYELGRGLRTDEGLANRWYRRASANGNARAQYNLALMLEQGRGAPPDVAEAMKLYRLAAAQNFAPAQNNLGILLAEGRGVPANFVEAFVWLSVAADNGVSSDVLGHVAQQLSPAGKEEAQAALDLLRIRLGRKVPAVVRPPEAAAVGASEPPSTASNEAMARELAGLRERLRVTTAELERERVENFRRADQPRASKSAAATVPAATLQELAGLKERVATATAELDRSRAENLQNAERLRETERERAELERRLAAAETVSRSAVLTASAAEAAGSTLVDSTLDVELLAKLYPKVAGLLVERDRLREESRQTAIELANLKAQVRVLQGQPSGASEAARADAERELLRRITVLRRTIDKLAEESRRNANLTADIAELRAENERLRAANSTRR